MQLIDDCRSYDVDINDEPVRLFCQVHKYPPKVLNNNAYKDTKMNKKIILFAGRQIFSCRIIVVQNSGRNCESIISWQGWRTQFLDLSFVHCTIFLFGMLDLRNVHFKRFICAFSFDWSILVKNQIEWIFFLKCICIVFFVHRGRLVGMALEFLCPHVGWGDLGKYAL